MKLLEAAIMDYSTASIHIFECSFGDKDDVEDALIKSGDYKPDTMALLYTKEHIDIIDDREA